MKGTIVQVSMTTGGLPRRAVAAARVGPLGLEGDVQRNRRFHGGPLRAVCLYSVEQLARLAAEGHAIGPGDLGENLTTRGLALEALAPGARLRAGSALLEITGAVPPCRTIARFFVDGRFGRAGGRAHPGEARLYARVIEPGSVAPGDPIEPVEPVD